ncbi:hypothetical protein TIFTF001_048532 [Ficus carica]|uniref:Uncharacterized protein n=1 Tax=Ficus carica TaxID=3494 RepID=A0AA87YNP5_FICCA|nr:hypothetical protein TIFTF001_048527 [Ficus carica]GMN18736.1 hypothetical protein TIFTF001_048528 [Ficus carica]GMN18742.1 hypothetical protein TIFTF001_048531 [Ficus carica]GMN18748.1 hypothetical protein TIFTF001_048532 [Ficus carica]
MRVVVDGYHKKYGRPLEKHLTLANYGHVEHALVTKIKCAVNRPGYHAEVVFHNLKVVPNRAKLCEAMIDRYTRAMRDIDQIDRETIVRVITTVAEIDMMTMKEEYRQKSGRALEDDISVAFADRQDCLQLILLILNPNSATN